MTNLELTQQAYSNFAAGNVPAVLAVFHPQIEWRSVTGMPYVQGDGIFVGAEAIVQNVFMNIPAHIDGFNIDVKEMFAADDKVVMVGFYEGTWKPTGKPFHANATHVWTFKDGLVTHFFQALDTAAIIN
jgi:ketosteroid isomerase-like protein